MRPCLVVLPILLPVQVVQPLARYTAASLRAAAAGSSSEPFAESAASAGVMAALQAQQAAEGAMHVLLLLLEAWSALCPGMHGPVCMMLRQCGTCERSYACRLTRPPCTRCLLCNEIIACIRSGLLAIVWLARCEQQLQQGRPAGNMQQGWCRGCNGCACAG